MPARRRGRRPVAAAASIDGPAWSRSASQFPVVAGEGVAVSVASRQGVLYASVNAEQAGGRQVGHHRGPHSAYTAIALKAVPATRTVPVPTPSTTDHADRAKSAQRAAERAAHQARDAQDAAQARQRLDSADRAAETADARAGR